ncbi:GNAT family N-acetyltransferase [Dactylosporangium sp. CS-033363]|uniref:GNAT family N-acetyltransferase n=1 Tax=Dactylosporangium sp. CS-033363 TaxID=3239935 RepID=UPI003D949917
MEVRAAQDSDRPWIRTTLAESWGETRIVVGGRARDASVLPALVAIGGGGRRAGLLTYEVGLAGLEVVSLDATERGGGAGTALLEAARSVAAGLGLRRVWLVTTNDNLDALRFYQRRGLRIAAVHPGAVDRGRLLKPGIPSSGEYDIDIHDEIELEATVSPARIRPGTMDDLAAFEVPALWVAQGWLHVADLDGRPVGALVLRAESDVVLRAESDVGLRVEPDLGLRAGSDVGLRAGSDVGLRAGSDVGLRVGSDVGLRVGSDVGLRVGSDVGLRAGSDVGLRAGSDVGLRAGSDVGLRAGSDVGLRAGSDVGLRAGSDVGLRAGPDVGLRVVHLVAADEDVRLALVDHAHAIAARRGVAILGDAA